MSACPRCGAAVAEIGPQGGVCARGCRFTRAEMATAAVQPGLSPAPSANGAGAAAGTPPEPAVPVAYAWHLHDAFLALDLPEPRPLVDGMLVAGTAATVFGPPGAGKTWLALSIARAVASGTPWLGRFATTQARVLVADAESHPAKLRERLAALNAAEPLPAGAPLAVQPVAECFIDDDEADPARGLFWLLAAIREFRPGLVILDALTRFHRAEENNAREMAAVNARLRQLMLRYGCALLVVDHANKPGLATSGEPGYRLRGSTEKLAFVDAAFLVEPDREALGRILVTPAKSRWTAAPEPFAVELVREGDGIRLVHGGTVNRDEASRPHEVVRAIAEITANHGPDMATKAAIAAYLGVSERTVERHITQLRKAGLVRERARDGGAGRRGRRMNVYEVVSE